jgi:WD40 repeat protein
VHLGLARLARGSSQRQGIRTENSTLLAPVRRLEGHTNGITRLIATADGRQLISASLDNSVRVWDLDGPTSGTTEVLLDSDSRRSEFKRTKKEEVLKQPGFPVETHFTHRTRKPEKPLSGIGTSPLQFLS